LARPSHAHHRGSTAVPRALRVHRWSFGAPHAATARAAYLRLSAKFVHSTCLPRRARHRTGPNPSLKRGLPAAGRLGRAAPLVYPAPRGQTVPPRPAA